LLAGVVPVTVGFATTPSAIAPLTGADGARSGSEDAVGVAASNRRHSRVSMTGR